MTTLVPKAKGKKAKPEPQSPGVIAFNEYERVSYYLALQGDFDFTNDRSARAAMFAQVDTGGKQYREIEYLTECRLESAKLDRIPKGLHIDGLKARTDELMRREPVKVEKTTVKKTAPVKKSAGLRSLVDSALA